MFSRTVRCAFDSGLFSLVRRKADSRLVVQISFGTLQNRFRGQVLLQPRDRSDGARPDNVFVVHTRANNIIKEIYKTNPLQTENEPNQETIMRVR